MVNESDLKTLIDNGFFGKVTYVSSNLDKDADKGTQFASVISFVTITVNDGHKNIDYNIVIKKQHHSEKAKEMFKSDDAFRNEYIMYTEIIPFLNADKFDLFPKLFQGNVKDGETLVFKNVSLEGYKIAKEKVFLDYDHIALALKKLGEFHGLSYVAKRKSTDEFYKLADQLIETKFTRDAEHGEYAVIPCGKRGIQPLIDKNIEVELLNKVMKKYDMNIEMAKIILKPEEPFSVICLGDFCRNNIFFKYENYKPIDVKFFDLQNAVYSTPAVDIAFFLYMNTTAELRDKHWDEFLSIYWNGVISTAKNIEFTFEEFLEHFSKRAIYGYLPTSFFLPVSVDEENPIDIDEFTKLTLVEKKERLLKAAGEYGTKLICDIVEHLLKKRYLHKFLELF